MSTALNKHFFTVALSPSIARLNLFITTETQVACINLNLIFVAVQLLDRNLSKAALFIGDFICFSLVEALMETFLQAFGESSFEGLHLRVGEETGSLVIAIEASRY